MINRVSQGYIRVGKQTPDKLQQDSLSYIKTGAIADIESGKATIESRTRGRSFKEYYTDRRRETLLPYWLMEGTTPEQME